MVARIRQQQGGAAVYARPVASRQKNKRSIWRVVAVTLLALVVGVAIATPLVLSLPPFGGELGGERLTRARASPLYRDGAFVNPLPPASYTWGDVRNLATGQFLGDEVREPPAPMPVLKIEPSSLRNTLHNPGLRTFWNGHASVYVEIDGQRLLIDPIFSEYASPFDVGPRRFHPPPIALADLPAIDGVLITHDHYDHLDMRAVQHLARTDTVFFVPLGVGAHLERWGVPPARIRDMEWGQQ